MQLRLVLLSVACFSCLIPSAVSFNLLAAKAVAKKAAEDVAEAGVNLLAAKKAVVAKAATDLAAIAAKGFEQKGNVLKTAAASMAATTINGAMSIGATIMKAGLNMVAAKFGAKPTLVYQPPTFVIQPPVQQDALIEETIVQEPVVVEYDQAIQVPVEIPPISTVSVDVRPQVWDIPTPPQLSQSVWTVNEAAPAFEIVGPANTPYVYEIVKSPRVQYGPVLEEFEFKKK